MFRLAAPLLLILAPALANAEVELSFYGGVQGAPHSGVDVDRPGTANDRDFTAGWDGNSFDAPPYYGLRATWWREDNLGFGVDLNHTKVYADDDTLVYARTSREHGCVIVALNRSLSERELTIAWDPQTRGQISALLGAQMLQSDTELVLTLEPLSSDSTTDQGDYRD